MSRQWKPGDLALVTYRLGQCTERNLCVKTDRGWDCLAPGVGFLMHGDVIDARPLVVLDPEDEAALERLGALMRASGCRWSTDIQTALREFADPKPPKPDEPQGLGAVVEDAEGRVFVRQCGRGVETDMAAPWLHIATRRDSMPEHRAELSWRDIAAVNVLSEGWRA